MTTPRRFKYKGELPIYTYIHSESPHRAACIYNYSRMKKGLIKPPVWKKKKFEI